MEYGEKLRFALIDLQEIAKTKTLLKGHLTLVAKRHSVKVKDLKFFIDINSINSNGDKR